LNEISVIYGMAMDMDISMDIQAKSVDMDIDMDGKFHIHGNPGAIYRVVQKVRIGHIFASNFDKI